MCNPYSSDGAVGTCTHSCVHIPVTRQSTLTVSRMRQAETTRKDQMQMHPGQLSSAPTTGNAAKYVTCLQHRTLLYADLHEELLTVQQALQHSSSQVPPAFSQEESPLALQNKGSSGHIAPCNQGISNVSPHQRSVAFAPTPEPCSTGTSAMHVAAIQLQHRTCSMHPVQACTILSCFEKERG